MPIKETATKRLSFNDHMDRWYAAHPEIIRVDWPELHEYQKEALEWIRSCATASLPLDAGKTSILKVRIVETGSKK